MRMKAVEDRLQSIVEKDWKQAATELLAERQRTGNGEVRPLLPLHLCLTNSCAFGTVIYDLKNIPVTIDLPLVHERIMRTWTYSSLRITYLLCTTTFLWD